MNDHAAPNSDEKNYWFDDARNVKKILLSLYISCGGLFVADFFYHKHADLEFESWFGFHAIYGFGACVLLVLAAKVMRKVLARAENYYEDSTLNSGERPDDR